MFGKHVDNDKLYLGIENVFSFVFVPVPFFPCFQYSNFL